MKKYEEPSDRDKEIMAEGFGLAESIWMDELKKKEEDLQDKINKAFDSGKRERYMTIDEWMDMGEKCKFFNSVDRCDCCGKMTCEKLICGTCKNCL